MPYCIRCYRVPCVCKHAKVRTIISDSSGPSSDQLKRRINELEREVRRLKQQGKQR